METVKATVKELYQLRALLDGLSTTKTEEGKEPITTEIVRGMIHEIGVPETTKRAAYKALRIINAELTPIQEQQQALFKVKGDDQVELTTEQLETAKTAEQTLLNDTVEFQVELIDFSKIENQSLTNNYGFLYEKLFK